ncbi:MAG: ATP-binding protein [Saprospiraceae bacterium]|nr:ATP-binding protein [Saprospiraceae bacterium]
MIVRDITDKIKSDLFRGKVILLFGARQVGKTTLVRELAEGLDMPYKWFSGDEPDIRLNMSNITSTQLKVLYGNTRLIIIDEAQRIENIGLMLKLSVDNFPDVQVIATGSSAFELAGKINEPLTGRKYEYKLFPFSFHELSDHFGSLEETRYLEHRLVYGGYPEVINKIGEEQRTLLSISDSYLYKDLFAYESIKKTSLFQKLLSALAFQTGSEVSYNELAGTVGANKETVEKYIDLLEQTFVIFRLNAFSRNVRNELKKSKKIYFYDNGIRNAIINNFLPLSSRNDAGALWENYLISERIKLMCNNGKNNRYYFWRTTQQQEIDYIEEENGQLSAYEFKWNENKKHNFPKTFLNAYPVSDSMVINRKNYSSFIRSI